MSESYLPGSGSPACKYLLELIEQIDNVPGVRRDRFEQGFRSTEITPCLHIDQARDLCMHLLVNLLERCHFVQVTVTAHAARVQPLAEVTVPV